MTCCAAAICAVVRHSVSSPLPVLGCSALPRHCHACLGAQSCDRARVASACAGTYPQGCSSPRPLCSSVTNHVSADYPTILSPCPLTVLSPALLWLSCASHVRSGSAVQLPLSTRRGPSPALVPHGPRTTRSCCSPTVDHRRRRYAPSLKPIRHLRYRPPLPSAAACAAAAVASRRSVTSHRDGA